MANSSAYSMLQVTITLDGQLVVGLWDGDDAVVITPSTDNGAGMVGADGSSIWSQSADMSVEISLKLQHTSPAHRLLMQKLKQAQSGRLVGFPLTVMDKLSGEGGDTHQAFIKGWPAVQEGTAASVREWTLWAGTWNLQIPNA